MDIYKIDTLEGMKSLEREWNPLLSESQGDVVFLTWEWMATWWEVFGHSFDLYLLVARDPSSGELVGIAPLMRERGSMFGRTLLRRLRFMSEGGLVTPEYLDFIIRKGREAECLSGFFDFLSEHRQDWDLLMISSLLESSTSLRKLPPVSVEKGFEVRWISQIECPYLELPETYEGYLASLSTHRRKNDRKKQSHLEKEFHVEFGGCEKEDQIDELLDQLKILHCRRMRQLGKKTGFTDCHYLAFHQKLAHRFFANGWLRLRYLKLNGRVVAIRYAYLYKKTWYAYNGGYEPEFGKRSVSNLLLVDCIRSCILENVRIFDFLGGKTPGKMMYASFVRKMENICIENDSLRTRYWALARAGWRLAYRMVSSGR